MADSGAGVGWRSSRKKERARVASAGHTAASAPIASGSISMDVNRSFLREDLEAMRRTLDQMPDTPARRRLRAILLLLRVCPSIPVS